MNEEIKNFVCLGRRERVFPLIVEGEPNAMAAGDLALEECLPPALRLELGGFRPETSLSLWVKARGDVGLLIGEGRAGVKRKAGKPGREPLRGFHASGTEGELRVGLPAHGTMKGDLELSVSNADLSEWSHLVVVLRADARTTRLAVYLNGRKVGEQSLPGNALERSKDRHLDLGGWEHPREGVEEFSHALFDDLRIWHRALTDQQVECLFIEGGWPAPR